MNRGAKTVLVGMLLAAVLAGISGPLLEGAARLLYALRYPPQGALIDVGHRRIQLDCRGSGSPTVVFEGGGDTLGSLSWAAVHEPVARVTRACAYSRAGILWSDSNSARFEPEGVARDIHLALNKSGEHPPFIMVGHSLGASYIMIFTGLYGPEVAGMVFVEGSHPDQIGRMRSIVGDAMDARTVAKPLEADAAYAWTGWLRLHAGEAAPTAPNPARAIAKAYFPQSLTAFVRELIAYDSTLQRASLNRDFGDRPLIVVTAVREWPPEAVQQMGISEEQGHQLAQEWQALQHEESSWSRRGSQILVRGSSHYVQFDRPDVVIEAVLNVVRAVSDESGPVGESHGHRVSSHPLTNPRIGNVTN